LNQKYDEESRLKEQLDLLIESLENDSENVRDLAVVQLSMFGAKAVPHLVSVLNSDLAEEARARSAEEAKNSYLELAIDGLIKTLGIISDQSTVDLVARALPRKEAVEALAKIGSGKSLDLIMDCIAAPVDTYGNPIGGALRNFVDTEQMSSPSNDHFVRTIFAYLGELGKPRLKEELASSDLKKRAAAASIARILHDGALVPELTLILKGHELAGKAEAARALQELGGPDIGPLLEKELFEIETRIEDLELSQSKEVSDLLVYSQLQETRDVIEKAILESGDADSLVEVGFHQAKRDEKFSIRSGFRRAIVRKGESAMPALTKYLTAMDRVVQANAADVIAEIKKSEPPR
jgi:HEAT repeat protein